MDSPPPAELDRLFDSSSPYARSAVGSLEGALGGAVQAAGEFGVSVSSSDAESAAVRSFFRAFEAADFVEWPAWRRLASVLSGNGGCFGLSGPRGAGKSWLMLRAVEEARKKGGIGVWYPSPSEYDPMSFVASLSYNVAGEIIRQLSGSDRNLRSELRRKFAVTAGLLTLFCLLLFTRALGSWYAFGPWFMGGAVLVLAGLVLSRRRPSSSRIAYVGAAVLFAIAIANVGAHPHYIRYAYRSFLLADTATGIAVLVAIAAAIAARDAWRRRGSLTAEPAPQLMRDASLLRDRVRYSSTRREGTEFGAEAGRSGLVGRFSRSREQELIERPLTLSGLIHDFRSLVALAGQVTGTVVVAIDELDKISDPNNVRELLRDIKGIFEVPRVHFLVSVSHEAARALNLGAVLERDEFNSSFYTVIDLPPFDPWYCDRLLQTRQADAQEGLGLVLGVIAGGNPREVLRLADLSSSQLCPDGWNPRQHAVLTAMRSEALGFRLDAISGLASNELPALSEDEKVGVYKALPEAAFTPTEFAELARTLMEDAWKPQWADSAWQARYEREWQKLLVRMFASSKVLDVGPQATREGQDTDNGVMLLDLQRATVMASHSAAVARLMLSQRPEFTLGESS
jgi:hypothetical protein